MNGETATQETRSRRAAASQVRQEPSVAWWPSEGCRPQAEWIDRDGTTRAEAHDRSSPSATHHHSRDRRHWLAPSSGYVQRGPTSAPGGHGESPRDVSDHSCKRPEHAHPSDLRSRRQEVIVLRASELSDLGSEAAQRDYLEATTAATSTTRPGLRRPLSRGGPWDSASGA